MAFSHAVFIGCGNMGGALLQCWQAAHSFDAVTVVDPALMEIKGARTVASAAEVEWDAVDIVIIAIKPQLCDAVLPDYAQYVPKNAIILSIVAGKESAYFQVFFPTQRIVRVMPNLPAMVGQGMQGAFAEGLSGTEKTAIDGLLQAAGKGVWLADESQMHALTATSGSGPAYVFYLMDEMVQAAQQAGLDKKSATTLVLQTFLGSAAYALESTESLETLRQNVTSKGGTTQAGLEVLMQEEGSIHDLLERTIAAAKDRSEELV